MYDFAIETTNLTKRYGDIAAVDGLDLRVRAGEVYGFLGANGAGKTTTLRMLLGLIRPTNGSVTVLGESPGSRRVLARTGSMIETPAFYPHLSGRENLLLLARYGGAGSERLDAVLDQVDLLDRADDAFRGYSLGMKQRLGVAAALLRDPDLLILDEPTNGLDPAGIADMRALIRHLGAGNRTVIVSSHVMQEIEQTCDRAGIIARGQLVAEGTIDELRGEDVLIIEADPLAEARQIVAGLPGVRDVRISGEGLRVQTWQPGSPDAAQINARLIREGIEVRELRRERSSLESVFLAITHGVAGEPAASDDATVRELEVSHV